MADLLAGILNREKKKPLGICIPDASKTKMEAEQRQREKEEMEKRALQVLGEGFNVSGIFHIQDSMMLQGMAIGVKIKKKDKLSLQGTKLEVKDIQVEGKTAGTMNPGQRGALFMKPEKGKFPMIKIGDVLEF